MKVKENARSVAATTDRAMAKKGGKMNHKQNDTTPDTKSQDDETTKKEKKFWWLKMKEGYMDSRVISLLHGMERGDTYFFIYLKLQLASLRNNGILRYEGYIDTLDLAGELSFEIHERAELVSETLNVMSKLKLIEQVSENEYLLPDVVMNVGSETEAASRMREIRAKKKP